MQKTTAVIIKKGNKFLLEKRLIKPYRSYWVLPGGHIKKKELPIETIKRETKEEIGIDIFPEYITLIEEKIPSIKWDAELYLFKSKLKGDPTPDKIEVSEIKWFSKKELKNIMVGFEHKKILNKYL